MTLIEQATRRSVPIAKRTARVAKLARPDGRAVTAKPDRVAVALGRGLLAGLAGTAAMTVSTALEAKLRGRGESTAAAEAVEKLGGVEPEDEQAESRLASVTHWLYGTSWGAPRALLGLTDLDAAKATAAHGALVWGSALVMLPALRISPPPTEWGAGQLAIDAFHHAVYAGAAGLAYEALER